MPVIDDAGMAALMNYHWPGNVRELRNVLERALILCDKDTITVDDLGLKQASPDQTDAAVPASLDAVFPESVSFHHAVDETKRFLIARALDLSSGTVKDAAALLGMTRNSIDHHMRQLKIRRPRNDVG